MSAPRSLPATSPARRSSICANPAPPRSRTIASRLSVNMRLRPRHVSLAGLRIESLSLTRISAFPVPLAGHPDTERVQRIVLSVLCDLPTTHVELDPLRGVGSFGMGGRLSMGHYRTTFDGPARAVRCGRAIADAVKTLGIRVRSGVHTGECEVIGEKLGGIAVHIGARVAAVAAADEVLVSSTVKDLVAGSGLRFESRGVHVLKGVPGEWTCKL
jgi:hypothetical protein